jgi:hypothetical protein
LPLETEEAPTAAGSRSREAQLGEHNLILTAIAVLFAGGGFLLQCNEWMAGPDVHLEVYYSWESSGIGLGVKLSNRGSRSAETVRVSLKFAPVAGPVRYSSSGAEVPEDWRQPRDSGDPASLVLNGRNLGLPPNGGSIDLGRIAWSTARRDGDEWPDGLRQLWAGEFPLAVAWASGDVGSAERFVLIYWDHRQQNYRLKRCADAYYLRAWNDAWAEWPSHEDARLDPEHLH